MSNCQIINNIKDTLLKEGIIDEYNHIKSGVGQTQHIIDEINKEVSKKWGVNPKNPTQPLVSNIVRRVGNKGVVSRLYIDYEYAIHLDNVRDGKTQPTFSPSGSFKPFIDGISESDRQIVENIFSEDYLNDKKPKEIKEVEDELDNLDMSSGEILFAPTLGPSTYEQDFTFGSSNSDIYQDWVHSRISMLKELEKTKNRLYLKNKKDPQIAELNYAIETLNAQLSEIDIEDVFSIERSALSEITALKNILKNVRNSLTNNNALALIVDNLVEKRINDLSIYFNGQDFINGDYKISESDTRSDFYTAFRDEHFLGNKATKEQQEIYNEINFLKDEYRQLRKNLVVSAFKNDIYVKEHIKNNDTDLSKKFNEVLEMIDKNDFEIDTVDKMFLGTASGGGLLGQLLYLKQQESTIAENNYAGKTIQKMQEIFNRFKNKKDSAGEYLTNYLFQKDNFGVRLNRLISLYSDNYFLLSRKANIEYESFRKTNNKLDYTSWLKQDRSVNDRIDISKLSPIYSKYKNHPKYAKFFVNVTQQDIIDYENQLRQSLGDLMYDIEVGKAIEKVNNYVSERENGFFTPLQEINNNPFAFLEQFNDFDNIAMSDVEIFSPEYTISIPKMSEQDYYNHKDFSKITSNKDLKDYYIEAYKLMTEYINPTFNSEGIDVGALDLETFEDELDRNNMKDLTVFGKINALKNSVLRSTGEIISDGFIGSIKNKLQDPKHKRDKLIINYRADIKRKIGLLSNNYSKYTPQQLIEKAKKVGIVGVDIKTLTKTLNNGTTVKTSVHRKLADSIARAEMSKITSSNVMETLHKSAYLAADVRARRSVIGFSEALLDISKVTTIADKNNPNARENKIGNTNIYSKLLQNHRMNILGEKFSGELDNKGRNLIQIFTRWNPFGIKSYSTSDKLTLKALKEGLENNVNIADVNYELGNFTYTFVLDRKKGVKEYRKTDKISGQVTKMTQQEYVKDYKKNLESQLGTPITVGSLALAWSHMITKTVLGLNPRAGIKNRIAGINQTLAISASRKFGFDLNHYYSSKRFLSGMNIGEYYKQLGFNPNRLSKKFEQIKMLEQLISTLDIQQNRSNDILDESRFGTSNKDRFEGFQNLLMDFATNNPEKHNQLEIIISIMMTTMIEDNKGNKVPMFDTKTHTFNIYEPGTNILKPEFRNDKNIALWEDFTSYTDPNTGEEFSDANAMTIKMRSAIESTQGNYNNHDMLMVQSTVTGKLATQFFRWFYENTNMQFGMRKVDLRTGQMDIKGRKIHLMEHIPTLLTYMAGNTVIPIMSGMIAIGTGLATAGVVLGSIGLLFGLRQMHRHFKFESFKAKKEWEIAKDFALETLILMGKTPLNLFTYGKVNPKFLDTTREKLLNKNYDGYLTPQARQALSENAQEIASKFVNYTTYTTLALVAKAMLTLLMEDNDESEETFIQSKLKELVNIENVVNALLNDRNQVVADLERFINPEAFIQDATSFAFFRTVSREVKSSIKIIKALKEGDFGKQEAYNLSKLSFIPGSAMVPNTVKKAIYGMYNKDVGVFSDDRVYQGKDDLDKYLHKNMKKGEDFYKAEARDLRKKYKSQVEEYIDDLIEIDYKDLSKNEKEELKEKLVNDFMKDVTKPRGKDNTYEDFINSGAFENSFEELERLKEELKNRK